MLTLFIEWATQAKDALGASGVEAWVTEGNSSDNPSARLDIDTPTAVARITCWECGDYNAEIVDLETERTLYSSHGVFRVEQPISEQVLPFLQAIGEGSRP